MEFVFIQGRLPVDPVFTLFSILHFAAARWSLWSPKLFQKPSTGSHLSLSLQLHPDSGHRPENLLFPQDFNTLVYMKVNQCPLFLCFYMCSDLDFTLPCTVNCCVKSHTQPLLAPGYAMSGSELAKLFLVNISCSFSTRVSIIYVSLDVDFRPSECIYLLSTALLTVIYCILRLVVFQLEETDNLTHCFSNQVTWRRRIEEDGDRQGEKDRQTRESSVNENVWDREAVRDVSTTDNNQLSRLMVWSCFSLTSSCYSPNSSLVLSTAKANNTHKNYTTLHYSK